MQFGKPPRTNGLWNVASPSTMNTLIWGLDRTAERDHTLTGTRVSSIAMGLAAMTEALEAASGGDAFYVLETGDVRTPALQSVFALCQELMPLIDRGYAGDRPRLVIENFVGDMRGDTKPSHAGDARAAQIMQPPVRDA